MSTIAPLNWRKASSPEGTYTLPARSAQPGLPIPATSAPRTPWMRGGPTTRPNQFPAIKIRPCIPGPQSPISPLTAASQFSPTSPRRPTRQAATKAKQRFSEVYAPLIIEGDDDPEDSILSPTGATFSRAPASLSWFSDSSDDDEYVDDGDDEADRKRSRGSRVINRRGNKRPRTADVENYYARLDHEKMIIAAGEAGARKRARLAEERKVESDAVPWRELAEKGKAASPWGAAQELGDSMECVFRMLTADATLADREDCVDAMDDLPGDEKPYGRPESDVTLVVGEEESERPFSDITLVEQ